MKCHTKKCRFNQSDMDDYCCACRELRDKIRPPACKPGEPSIPHEWTREADETAAEELAGLDALELVTPLSLEAASWKE